MTLGLVLCASFATSASVSAATPAAATSTQEHGYKTVNAEELKSWIDSGKAMQIIDARPKKYEDGDVITGAKFLPFNADAKAIAKALPSKDALIVVYCASVQCPASGLLGDQLVKMGYTNVYKYPGGINEWMEKKLPTQKLKG